MTPLMLACITNNFPIVQCLLLRGHTIQVPHFLSCECRLCKRQTVTNRSSTRIVDVMRALASESYLWLATDDVFVAACSVAHDLQTLINEDCLEHVEVYRHLEANVQRFLARVSDQAWRAEEFNLLVSNQNFCARRNTEISSPRLQMAMDAEMRQFTCSTNSQTTIKSVFRAGSFHLTSFQCLLFFKDWLNFGNKPKRDAWRLLRSSIFMPVLVMIHAFSPNQCTTMAVPLARYIAHLSMYLLFLVAAILRPTIIYYPEFNAVGYAQPVRILEGFMYTYIMGLLLEKSLLFYRVGKETFFSFWWRWFDVVLIFSFLLSFVFFIGTITPREQFDPLLLERTHWPSGEFALLHEIFLSIACVLGISKMFYYIQMIKGIGGSVISIGKCVGKTYTYLLIMIAIILSFSVGLNILVSPYLNRKSMKTDTFREDKITTQSYDTIGTSSKNLFWSIFGYLGPSTYITVVGNAGENMDPVSHQLNSATLEILGAMYHGIIIITVLNLMTSLLVKKADEVLDNEEMEFKYTRAAMYTEFITWEMAAPPPFNIILVPAHLIHRTLLNRVYESPGWGTKPPKNMPRDQKIMDELYLKEEKAPNHVSFLSSGPHSYPMDNTFEGWRKRETRRMIVPNYDDYEEMQRIRVGKLKNKDSDEVSAFSPELGFPGFSRDANGDVKQNDGQEEMVAKGIPPV
ncbi:hypothetical protein CAEBREN_18021 [Caenorhabditis brenneri]|uniref:Transient receptor ion channel domain-containing protein n=1 Tax=Caenorhabditis brenneri TaxID=135651 RepID=G0MKR7_CAEBE|nr:hypothetical protein CAEBREN_18021 [Caenorhabditis brenneri]